MITRSLNVDFSSWPTLCWKNTQRIRPPPFIVLLYVSSFILLLVNTYHFRRTFHYIWLPIIHLATTRRWKNQAFIFWRVRIFKHFKTIKGQSRWKHLMHKQHALMSKSVMPVGSSGSAVHGQSPYLYPYRSVVMNACSPVQTHDWL